MKKQTSSGVAGRVIRLYPSGPMSGKPDFNYPLFNRVTAVLRGLGYVVNNPAENFGGDSSRPRPDYFRVDVANLLDSDAIVMLPGWQESMGANLELDIAIELGLQTYQWVEGDDDGACGIERLDVSRRPTRGDISADPLFDDNPKLPPRADVLHEAQHLITGDRNNSYGPPTQDFRRTAEALTAMGYRRVDADDVTMLPLVPSDVALMVGMVKISRLMHSRSKRDNWTDLAGYAGCGYECSLEEEKA